MNTLLPEVKSAMEEGAEAARSGLSAKDNPYLNSPLYLAQAWWDALCKESSKIHNPT